MVSKSKLEKLGEQKLKEKKEEATREAKLKRDRASYRKMLEKRAKAEAEAYRHSDSYDKS